MRWLWWLWAGCGESLPEVCGSIVALTDPLTCVGDGITGVDRVARPGLIIQESPYGRVGQEQAANGAVLYHGEKAVVTVDVTPSSGSAVFVEGPGVVPICYVVVSVDDERLVDVGAATLSRGSEPNDASELAANLTGSELRPVLACQDGMLRGLTSTKPGELPCGGRPPDSLSPTAVPSEAALVVLAGGRGRFEPLAAPRTDLFRVTCRACPRSCEMGCEQPDGCGGICPPCPPPDPGCDLDQPVQCCTGCGGEPVCGGSREQCRHLPQCQDPCR